MVMQKVSCGRLLNNAVAVRLLQLGARAVAAVPACPRVHSNAFKKKKMGFFEDLPHAQIADHTTVFCFIF
jgi:hypothetical protein